jgi:hypothetical protein
MAVQGGADGAAGLAMGQLMPGVSAQAELAGASQIGNVARGAGDYLLRWTFPSHLTEHGQVRWRFLCRAAGPSARPG